MSDAEFLRKVAAILDGEYIAALVELDQDAEARLRQIADRLEVLENGRSDLLPGVCCAYQPTPRVLCKFDLGHDGEHSWALGTVTIRTPRGFEGETSDE
jgi:hypothetical protein